MKSINGEYMKGPETPHEGRHNCLRAFLASVTFRAHGIRHQHGIQDQRRADIPRFLMHR